MAWQRVASLDELWDGGVVGIDVDGTPIALYRIGDDVHATDGMCTHAFASLADGFAEDGTIECPLHQAVFDIRTGKALCEPATEDLRVYPVKIEGTDVLIDLQGAGPASEQASLATTGHATVTAQSVGATARSNDSREAATAARDGNGNGTPLSKQYVWPGDDLTRIPDWVYTDHSIYEREVER